MRRHRGEDGFTLAELLMSLAVLGVISAVLVEVVLIVIRTTDGSIARISGAEAAKILTSYATADIQTSDDISDPAVGECAAGAEGVFLRATWSDVRAYAVEYALDPPTGEAQDVVRWSCVEGIDAPQRTFIGHFAREQAGAPPVVALCDGAACPVDPPAYPAEVTLRFQVPGAANHAVTVRRRTP